MNILIDIFTQCYMSDPIKGDLVNLLTTCKPLVYYGNSSHVLKADAQSEPNCTDLGRKRAALHILLSVRACSCHAEVLLTNPTKAPSRLREFR